MTVSATNYKVEISTLYYPDRAPLQVTLDVDLQSSPAYVWRVIVDCKNWNRWFPGVTSCFETTPLPKIAENIEMKGLIPMKRLLPLMTTAKLKYGHSVFGTNQPIANCWVERAVLEPLLKDNGQVVGTRVQYAAGTELVWYMKLFLQPILPRMIESSWKQALQQIDKYVISSSR